MYNYIGKILYVSRQIFTEYIQYINNTLKKNQAIDKKITDLLKNRIGA